MKHEEDIDNQDIEDVKPQLGVEEHVKNGQVIATNFLSFDFHMSFNNVITSFYW